MVRHPSRLTLAVKLWSLARGVGKTTRRCPDSPPHMGSGGGPCVHAQSQPNPTLGCSDDRQGRRRLALVPALLPYSKGGRHAHHGSSRAMRHARDSRTHPNSCSHLYRNTEPSRLPILTSQSKQHGWVLAVPPRRCGHLQPGKIGPFDITPSRHSRGGPHLDGVTVPRRRGRLGLQPVRPQLSAHRRRRRLRVPSPPRSIRVAHLRCPVRAVPLGEATPTVVVLAGSRRIAWPTQQARRCTAVDLIVSRARATSGAAV